MLKASVCFSASTLSIVSSLGLLKAAPVSLPIDAFKISTLSANCGYCDRKSITPPNPSPISCLSVILLPSGIYTVNPVLSYPIYSQNDSSSAASHASIEPYSWSPANQP